MGLPPIIIGQPVTTTIKPPVQVTTSRPPIHGHPHPGTLPPIIDGQPATTTTKKPPATTSPPNQSSPSVQIIGPKPIYFTLSHIVGPQVINNIGKKHQVDGKKSVALGGKVQTSSSMKNKGPGVRQGRQLEDTIWTWQTLSQKLRQALDQ